MKVENPAYRAFSSESVQEPRYVLGIDFSGEYTQGTDPTHFEYLENLLTYSEQFDHANWLLSGTPVISPNIAETADGIQTADSIEDNDAAGYEFIHQTNAIDINERHTVSILVGKDGVGRATRFPALRLEFLTGGTVELNDLNFDTGTGDSVLGLSESTSVAGGVVDYSDQYWKVTLSATPTDLVNTEARVSIYPAAGASATWVYSNTAIGTLIINKAHFREAASSNNYVISGASTSSGWVEIPDVVYFTSHADAYIPGNILSANRIDGVVMPNGISGQSQKVSPDKAQHTIGNVKFKLLDINSEITTTINTRLGGNLGLRKKTITLYKGHAGMDRWDDYSLRLTYLIDGVSNKDGVYTFITSDIQRTTKSRIFELHQGILTSTLSLAEITEINVTIANADTRFPTLEHDAVWSANPSVTVGYIKIDDEIICHNGWTDGTFTKLGIVQRGALNTVAVEHVVTAINDDQKKRVEEYVYIEMSVLRLIYAILTGTVVGQAGGMPDHWHLGIGSEFVTLSDFTDVGMEDLWDQTTQRGRMVKFTGIKGVVAKQFIEKELLLWAGVFMPIYSNGAYGLKRLVNVLPFSPYAAWLPQSEVVSYGDLTYDYGSVINNIIVNWNWLDNLEQYRKQTRLIDTASIARHGSANELEYSFRGVFTGAHSDQDIINYFRQIRNRYGGPPIRLKIDVMPQWDALEVGDAIRLDLSLLKDYYANDGVSRTFEVQQVATNWITGKVSLSLFGGTEASTNTAISASVVMADDYYVAQAITDGGTELSTVLTIVGGAVTASGTLTGNIGTRAIFYYDGDLTINAGSVVTFTNSVELRIKGSLIINEPMIGSENGHVGAVTVRRYPNIDTNNNGGPTGTRIGTTRLGNRGTQGANGEPGVSYSLYAGTGNGTGQLKSSINTGLFAEYIPSPRTLSSLNILNPDGLSLTGIPNDMSGSSGSAGNGGHLHHTLGISGNGGNGGAGILIVSRGAGFGGSGGIRSNGEKGKVSSNNQIYYGFYRNLTFAAAAGAGGSAGAIIWLLDGNASLPDKTFLELNSGGSANVPASYVHPLGAWRAYFNFSSNRLVAHARTNFAENQVDDASYFGYIPVAENGFVWMPSDEEAETPGFGYNNQPVDWDDLTDDSGTQPFNNADVTSAQLAGSGVNVANYEHSVGEGIQRVPVSEISGTPSIDNVVSYFGSNSFKSVSSGGGSADSIFALSSTDYNVRITPNRKWILSVWCRSDTTVAATQLHLRTDSVIYYTQNSQCHATPDTWLRVSTFIDLTSDNATSCLIRLDNDAANLVEVFWDGLMLEEAVGDLTTPSAYALPANSLAPDWNDLSGAGLPADNADVTSTQLAGSGVNVLNYEYSVGESIQRNPSNILNGFFSHDPTEFYFGASSYKMRATASNMYMYLGSSTTDYNIRISPNKTWIVSAYVKSDTISANGRIFLYRAGGNDFVTFTTSGTADTWTRISAVFDLSADADTMGILRLRNDNFPDTDVEMWFDGLMMEEQIGDIETPSAYALPADSLAPDWNDLSGAGLPADNADVALEQLSGSGVNVASFEWSIGESASRIPTSVVNGTVEIDGAQSFFGASSFKLSATAAGNLAFLGEDSVDYNIKLSPNKKWIASVYVRSSHASSAGKLSIRTSSAGTYYDLSFTTSGTLGTWTLASALIDLSSDGSTTALMRISNDAGTGVDIWFDGIMLEPQVGTLLVPGVYTLPSAKEGSATQILASGGDIISPTNRWYYSQNCVDFVGWAETESEVNPSAVMDIVVEDNTWVFSTTSAVNDFSWHHSYLKGYFPTLSTPTPWTGRRKLYAMIQVYTANASTTTMQIGMGHLEQGPAKITGNVDNGVSFEIGMNSSAQSFLGRIANTNNGDTTTAALTGGFTTRPYFDVVELFIDYDYPRGVCSFWIDGVLKATLPLNATTRPYGVGGSVHARRYLGCVSFYGGSGGSGYCEIKIHKLSMWADTL